MTMSGESCSSGSCNEPGKGLPPGMLKKYNLNQSPADGTVVWIETESREDEIMISNVSAELVGMMRESYDARIFGVIFGGTEIKHLYTQLFEIGIDTLYHVRGPGVSSFSSEAYADALKEVCERIGPAVILLGGTEKGREISRLIAAKLKINMTEDCTGIRMNDRNLVADGRACGNNINLMASCPVFPQLATICPGVYPMPEAVEGRKGTVIYWQYRGQQQPR